MTVSNNQLSGWSQKFQSTFECQVSVKKWSCSLFGKYALLSFMNPLYLRGMFTILMSNFYSCTKILKSLQPDMINRKVSTLPQNVYSKMNSLNQCVSQILTVEKFSSQDNAS